MASRVLHGVAPVDKVVSTVGAGDALLAGYLSAPADTDEAVRIALTWAAAAVQHQGTLFTTATPTAITLSQRVPRAQKLT